MVVRKALICRSKLIHNILSTSYYKKRECKEENGMDNSQRGEPCQKSKRKSLSDESSFIVDANKNCGRKKEKKSPNLVGDVILGTPSLLIAQTGQWMRKGLRGCPRLEEEGVKVIRKAVIHIVNVAQTQPKITKQRKLQLKVGPTIQHLSTRRATRQPAHQTHTANHTKGIHDSLTCGNMRCRGIPSASAQCTCA